MNEIIKKRIETKAVVIGLDFRDAVASGGSKRDAAEAVATLTQTAANWMAEWLLEHLWISVDEALPEVDGHGYSKPVLAMDDTNELLVATYSKIYDKWNAVGPVSYHRLVVTHWMSIPQLEGGEK